MAEKEKISCNEKVLVNGVFKKLDNGKCCPKPSVHAKPGNFVPVVDDHIDLASSTYVNNPIIPPIKPPDHELRNKKYQAIIGFDKDIKGKIWPEWMEEPILHALGRDTVSAEVKYYVDKNVIPLINKVDGKIDGLSLELSSISGDISINITELSQTFIDFTHTPATISSLGLVKSSDKIDQISVLEDGVMEVNGVSLSRLSQDVDLVIFNPPIEENPYGKDYFQ